MSTLGEEIAVAGEKHNGSQLAQSTSPIDTVHTRTRPYGTPTTARSRPAPGQVGIHQTIEPQQEIFCEGDHSDYYFQVRKGIVRAEKILVDGRRQVLGIFFPGDYFGFSQTGEYDYSAEAANAGGIFKYKRSQLLATVEQNPSVANRLVAIMASEIRAARERSLVLGCRAPLERVATFLLMLAERQDCDGETPIQLDMTREQIGDYLGLCMETVSRGISRLRASHMIELVSPHQIVIVDRNGLTDLANPAIIEAF